MQVLQDLVKHQILVGVFLVQALSRQQEDWEKQFTKFERRDGIAIVYIKLLTVAQVFTEMQPGPVSWHTS